MKPQLPGHQSHIGVFATRLERMAVPLTVLHANIQLLQRRLRNGTVPEPESLLRVLDKMEQASRTLIAELRELDEPVSTPHPIHEMMGGNESTALHEKREREE